MAYWNGMFRLWGLLLLGVMMAEEAQALQQIGPAKTMHHQALRETIQKRGTLPVIVRLSDEAVLSVKSPVVGSNGLSYNSLSVVQQRVLDALPVKDVPVKRYRYIPYMAMHVNADVLDALMGHTDVVEVVEDAIFETMLTESISVIGANAAWEYGGSGKGQVVAILDTGVDHEHPFLAGKVVHGGCFSTNYASQSQEFVSISTCPGGEEEAYGIEAGAHCGMGVSGCDHGTRVAGIAAGKSDTFSGVARDADILPVQVFSRFESYCGDTPCARSWVSDQIAGLEYIYTMSDSLDIAAVNMSLGGGHYTSQAHCDEVNPAMRAIFDVLSSKGIPVIAAAGNSGLPDGLVAPACLSNAVSVGSTSLKDQVSSFSNSAEFLDFWAPGQEVVSSVPGNGFQSGTGTSFAAPHVAGAWAILKSKSPRATTAELKEALKKTGRLVTDERNDMAVARIQVDRALQFTLLPVELVRFEAVAEEERVEVLWETASESNNAGFELQHSWGGNYYTVAFIPGGGTQQHRRQYTYGIENLAPGRHSFRLKQVDFDGTQTYTHSIDTFVSLNNAAHMGAVYPNPFNPLTQFTLTVARSQFVRVEVYNVLGARVAVLFADELVPQDIHVFTLEAGHLPSGIYLIQVLGEHFKVTRRAMLLK